MFLLFGQLLSSKGKIFFPSLVTVESNSTVVLWEKERVQLLKQNKLEVFIFGGKREQADLARKSRIFKSYLLLLYILAMFPSIGLWCKSVIDFRHNNSKLIETYG